MVTITIVQGLAILLPGVTDRPLFAEPPMAMQTSSILAHVFSSLVPGSCSCDSFARRQNELRHLQVQSVGITVLAAVPLELSRDVKNKYITRMQFPVKM